MIYLQMKILFTGGEVGKDLCTGDGGGPLVCEIKNHPNSYYLSGIVVGGIGCGRKDVPAFYLDVAKYRDWIDEKMSALGITYSGFI